MQPDKTFDQMLYAYNTEFENTFRSQSNFKMWFVYKVAIHWVMSYSDVVKCDSTMGFPCAVVGCDFSIVRY